jgi:hypothetical protein
MPCRDRPYRLVTLYRSPLWIGRRAYAQASRRPWMILSAMHRLVDPEERLAPYDLALTDLDAHERRAWGERVARVLEHRFGDLTGIVFEIHAGDAYRGAVEPGGAGPWRPGRGTSRRSAARIPIRVECMPDWRQGRSRC